MSMSLTEHPDPISDIHQREQTLAPYAMHSDDSQGRQHAEPEHSYRNCYQRDRDRILHCSAFRRLSGKMQVFTGEMGDYHRTRLTHTQEVASVARTIGRVLRLNEDLIEALALVHDIGHPPYGHAGEDVLNECMQDCGGFSHNRFGLTIVTEIEQRYPDFPGLNLTHEVLLGQTERIDKTQKGAHSLLEVQLVDAADSITYDAHDTDDAVKLRLVTLPELMENSLVAECAKIVRRKYAAIDDHSLQIAVVRQLVERQVTDLIENSRAKLAENDFGSAAEVCESRFVLGHSRELSEQKNELEEYLYKCVYRHPELMTIRTQAQRRLQRMYQGYCERPELLPRKYQPRVEQIGIRRMAGEYIAGMTDRFCDSSYRMHFATHLSD